MAEHDEAAAGVAHLPKWTVAAPVVAWAMIGAALVISGAWFVAVLALALVGAVLAAVHHAEAVAHRVGEPFGTLVLAIAVTLIEVALIVSLMIAGGAATAALARDTVFATLMIILTGMVGTCLLVGAMRHREQTFGIDGVTGALTTLATIAVLTLILPNYDTHVPGPVYGPGQLAFIALVSLVLYGTFVLVQTVRHRGYFLEASPSGVAVDAPPPSNRATAFSATLLLVCLAAVVLLAKKIAPTLEDAVARAGAPPALVGVIIAGVVLMPEGIAAVRAARQNRLQTSLNLALGSALASIGLTIPAVAIVSLATGLTLTLGIDGKSTVLLVLSLFVTALALRTGKTTILQGTVLIVIFAVYLGSAMLS
jgi:Ca2+:H+ antiporter